MDIIALIIQILMLGTLIFIFKPAFDHRLHKWIQDWAAELGLKLQSFGLHNDGPTWTPTNCPERAMHCAKILDLAVDLGHQLTVSGIHLPARLADNAANDRLSGVRKQNLLALERHFPKRPENVASYRAALEDLAPELRILAADFLLDRPGTELAEVDEVAAALAQALGQFGGSEAQSALLGLLRSRAPEVQQETAKALGKMGVEAVESLLELARSAKSPMNEIAFDAARRIQGRLPEAAASQLSLVAPPELEGALSPAADAPGPGDVSVAEAQVEIDLDPTGRGPA